MESLTFYYLQRTKFGNVTPLNNISLSIDHVSVTSVPVTVFYLSSFGERLPHESLHYCHDSVGFFLCMCRTPISRAVTVCGDLCLPLYNLWSMYYIKDGRENKGGEELWVPQFFLLLSLQDRYPTRRFHSLPLSLFFSSDEGGVGK